MIPFNHLGPVFKTFASLVYPHAFRKIFVSAVRAVPAGGAVLDVGSGTGVLSQFARAARKDLRFTMIDPAPGMLRFAPGFAEKTVGRAESMPFRDCCFDLVCTGDALHHFGDPAAALGELGRVLKDGGYLVVFEIDPGSPLGAVITRGERMLREPAHFYRPFELDGMLAGGGFKCRVDQYGWRYSIIASAGGRR